MNYVIFDLEFNQRHPDNKTENSETPKLMFEIIQIGAVKLDTNFKTIATFDAFVKPTVHIDLHPYVENLTNITYDQIHSSKVFTEVLEDFLNFIGNDEVIFVLWGSNDIKELIRNAKFYNIQTDKIPKKYIDIQSHTSKAMDCLKGTKIGLKTAIEKLEIPSDLEFHNAFNDALYTSKIFEKIYNKEIKPVEFIYISKRKTKQIKGKINNAALFKQFEKMYNRNLTNEEKAMIKLAYIMGKTNQFCE